MGTGATPIRSSQLESADPVITEIKPDLAGIDLSVRKQISIRSLP
jgi:hypothetical protein